MGTGPIPASKKALSKAGWGINDVDLVEANEAFAAQSLVVMKELNIPKEKLNVNGGASTWASSRSNRYKNTGYTHT